MAPPWHPQIDAVGRSLRVAASHTTVCMSSTMSMSHTTPVSAGKSLAMNGRTQVVLEASRQLPAHRRVPAFLSGLWWKLLSVQPARVLMCLPHLSRIGNGRMPLGSCPLHVSCRRVWCRWLQHRGHF